MEELEFHLTEEANERKAVGLGEDDARFAARRDLACGVALGIPAAMMITRLVSSLLFGLSPRDPGTIIAALSALTIATIAAAYVPARRAASIDPIFALREE